MNSVLLIANYSSGSGGISTQVELLHQCLEKEGISTSILSTKGSISRRLLAPFRLLHDGRKYDVFHIHGCSFRGFFPVVVGCMIGWLLRKRVIVTYHGGQVREFFSAHRNLVRFFLSRVYENTVLSSFAGEVFSEHGLQYKVVPNISNLEGTLQKRESLHPRFISIRSLAPVYDVECTVLAFEIVKETYPDAILTIAGDGPLRNDLLNLVESRGIKDVKFVGAVPHDELDHYLKNADIMLSSSLADNMPMSILEAFAAGLLVISSKVGGIPCMVEDSVNGLLFEPGNHEQMASKILQALKDQEKTLNMIESAHDSLSAYSWSSVKKLLLPLYE